MWWFAEKHKEVSEEEEQHSKITQVVIFNRTGKHLITFQFQYGLGGECPTKRVTLKQAVSNGFLETAKAHMGNDYAMLVGMVAYIREIMSANWSDGYTIICY